MKVRRIHYFVEYLMTVHGLDKQTAKSIYNDLFNIILNKLIEGDTVHIERFGIFEVAEKKPKNTLLMKGVCCSVPYKIKFRASKTLKLDTGITFENIRDYYEKQLTRGKEND